MLINFKADVFDWLRENSGGRSVASLIVEIVQDRINSSQKGANNGTNEEGGRSTEQLCENTQPNIDDKQSC